MALFLMLMREWHAGASSQVHRMARQGRHGSHREGASSKAQSCAWHRTIVTVAEHVYRPARRVTPVVLQHICDSMATPSAAAIPLGCCSRSARASARHHTATTCALRKELCGCPRRCSNTAQRSTEWHSGSMTSLAGAPAFVIPASATQRPLWRLCEHAHKSAMSVG